jgi:[FeFe] hydrogenase H-cluster maturation GTPase HydF
MQSTQKSMRLHIAFFGRRNVGKSSLLNAITRQQVSIVSEMAGTTTDPVEKPMELLPLGPVLFIDTAGIDDTGSLGIQRVDRTRKALDRTEMAILVVGEEGWSDFEETLLQELKSRNLPIIVVFNKTDIISPDHSLIKRLAEEKIESLCAVASTGEGILKLREAIIRTAPEDFISSPPLVSDLVPPGEMAVLVVPIDMEAPKGRLITPQVQTIRELLDNDSLCMVVKERELRQGLSRLNAPPALVITDSQAFLKVAADIPLEVPMTSFSILFSRLKGDIAEFALGAMAIEKLHAGSKVLICEACTHHPIGDDIGSVKIPRWLRQYVGGNLQFTHYHGNDFPADLDTYDIVIHCGSCALNRRAVLNRILRCKSAGVPITNYGMCIAYTLGLFERALGPFPAALEIYKSQLQK